MCVKTNSYAKIESCLRVNTLEKRSVNSEREKDESMKADACEYNDNNLILHTPFFFYNCTTWLNFFVENVHELRVTLIQNEEKEK